MEEVEREGAKEVAMAVSLHTACTFRSHTSLGNSLRVSVISVISLPTILTSVRRPPSPFVRILPRSISLSLSFSISLPPW